MATVHAEKETQLEFTMLSELPPGVLKARKELK